MIKSLLMERLKSEINLDQNNNLLSILSTMAGKRVITAHFGGAEFDSSVKNFINEYWINGGYKVNLQNMDDFWNEVHLAVKMSEVINKYGLNGSLSNFGIDQIPKPMVDNLPFLKVLENLKGVIPLILSADYISNENNGRFYFVAAFNLSKVRRGIYTPKLKFSNYVQLPDNVESNIHGVYLERRQARKINFWNGFVCSNRPKK